MIDRMTRMTSHLDIYNEMILDRYQMVTDALCKGYKAAVDAA